MRIRLNEDYYQWCCEWCDSENSILWAKVSMELRCGACHKKQLPGGMRQTDGSLLLSAGVVETNF